jgi:hypothetical protein
MRAILVFEPRAIPSHAHFVKPCDTLRILAQSPHISSDLAVFHKIVVAVAARLHFGWFVFAIHSIIIIIMKTRIIHIAVVGVKARIGFIDAVTLVFILIMIGIVDRVAQSTGVGAVRDDVVGIFFVVPPFRDSGRVPTVTSPRHAVIPVRCTVAHRVNAAIISGVFHIEFARQFVVIRHKKLIRTVPDTTAN